MKAIAHVRKNGDGTWAEPQGLKEQLFAFAKLSGVFAKAFHSEDWG